MSLSKQAVLSSATFEELADAQIDLDAEFSGQNGSGSVCYVFLQLDIAGQLVNADSFRI